MSKYYNAMEENYDLMEIDGNIVLFTNSRIDRNTIPYGLCCYDIRETDGGSGDPATVEPYVWVNHWGTIITKVSFLMNSYTIHGMAKYFHEIGDYSYLGASNFTIDEYVNTEDFSEYF